MKKILALILSFVLIPMAILAQGGKNMKYKTINVSTTFNYYPTLEPYSWVNSFLADDDNLLLTFLTANSGTFVIEEDEPFLVNRTLTNNLPSQLLNVGASVQIINENSSFHELSLTKLSFSKSSYSEEYFVQDTLGDFFRALTLGYEQNTAAFAFRYEFGKYFGDAKRSGLRFGISGAIEPSLYTYKRTPYSPDGFPIKANLITLDIALIPMLSAKISKKLSLDFKVIPNVLIADFGRVREQNPILPDPDQEGSRTYNLPEVNVALGLLVRYKIQEPQKRRRRRSDP